MSNDSSQNDDSFYMSKHYFDLGGATDDVSLADGVKDTSAAVAKLAGKALFNAGIFAGKTSFFVVKEAIRNGPAIVANIAEKNLSQNGHRMTDEQREKTEAYVNENKGKKLF